MKMMLALLSVSAVLLVSGFPSAQADFQRDIIRDSVKKQRDPSADFPGITYVQSRERLDLKRPFTAQEMEQVQAALMHAYGDSEIVKNELPRLEQALRQREPAPTNVFFYAGVNVGVGIGFNSNLAVIFGHDEDGQLAFVPTLLTRVQAYDTSFNFHIGLGTLDARDITPTLTVGGLIGGAYFVGAGVGRGFNDERWIELQFGFGFQVGPYIEFIL